MAERHARRSSHRRPQATETDPPEQAAPPTKPQGNENGGKLAAQAESHGAGDNATPYGHKQRAQGKRNGGGIGKAQNIKTPYRCVKMGNRAYSRKAPEYTEGKRSPRTA